MLPENLPYYCGPRITSPADSSHQEANAAYCECLQTSITSGVNVNAGMSHLSHVPVRFGDFNTVTPASAHASTNHEIPCLAIHLVEATSLQPSHPTIFPFASNLYVINTGVHFVYKDLQ